VAIYFLEKGICRNKVSGKHLEHLYDALRKTPHSPLASRIELPGVNSTHAVMGSEVCGVIIETREHPALEFVVCQFSERLNIPIQLFHGETNKNFIMNSKIAALINQGKVVLSTIDANSLSAGQYNAVCLSRQFWEALIGRNKILVFQTDAILCAASDFELADFTGFDYIGSKWPRKRPVGMLIDGGNGGFSLRSWQKSVQCIERFLPAQWPGGEDGYFAFHLDLIGGKVGRDEDCAKFSTQFEFLKRSFGGHQISLLDPESRKAFLEYCPEAKHVLQ
jgi:hypothetical protein